MKVLITGANGQLGKEFSKYFFMGKIDYLSTNKSNFDITNLEQMREFLKSYKDITHIINCAAYTNVDEAENNWNKAYLINSKGVKNLVEISKEIKKCANESIIINVTNPVDVLTYFLWKELDIPKNKVIGTGTILDTARFRALVSKQCGVSPASVHAYIVGEHGDSELMVWSSATIGGVNIKDFCKVCNRKNCSLSLSKFLYVAQPPSCSACLTS